MDDLGTPAAKVELEVLRRNNSGEWDSAFEPFWVRTSVDGRFEFKTFPAAIICWVMAFARADASRIFRRGPLSIFPAYRRSGMPKYCTSNPCNTPAIFACGYLNLIRRECFVSL
jgi:hypothetical protein